MIEDDIHYSNRRLVAIKKKLARFERNGKMVVRFVDAMTAYGITAIMPAKGETMLGIFIFGFEDKAVLVMASTLHATSSGLFQLYFVLALAMKLAAYYTGMTRSLTLVISIRKRRFSKLESMFTQADIIIAVILAAVAGLVEHAMVNAA